MYVITDHDHDYYKKSVKPRFTGDFAVQTDLTMEDVEHMETLTKETDHILREQFVNKITSSDSAVKRYLGVPSIAMLFGLFGKKLINKVLKLT